LSLGVLELLEARPRLRLSCLEEGERERREGENKGREGKKEVRWGWRHDSSGRALA
jgi:hypothetical protein